MGKRWSCLSLIVCVALWFSTDAVFAESMSWVDSDLKAFELDPKGFATDPKHIAKYDPETLEPVDLPSKFSKDSIETGEFLLEKDSIRQKIMQPDVFPRAEIAGNDRPETLVDRLAYRRLRDMDLAGLRSSTLPVSPWSGDYWPIFKGGIAQRFADPAFPNSESWEVNSKYLRTTQVPTDQLSPAEKFDLLMGDRTRALTESALSQGKKNVESWAGICHGWAPASFMVARPTKSIQVLAADGRTPIRFYPDDIKALVSQSWAKDLSGSRYIGGRCMTKNPPTDASGRILTQDCFDTNPGTWHLSIVNQLGSAKRGLILDSTFDYEVWNQPAYSYQYSYFNPQTLKGVGTLQEAMVQRKDFTRDRFSRYRAARSVYVVGIAMKLVYIAETNPTPAATDSPQIDRKIAVNYLYDVELDEDQRIIGGEWYQQMHPDFLWVPTTGAKPTSPGDQYLGQNESPRVWFWDGTSSIPRLWPQASQVGSRSGYPLVRMIDSLVKLSR